MLIELTKSGDPLPEVRVCSTWEEIRDCLSEFPAPATLDSDGEVSEKAWVFRGIGCSTYKLETAIERAVGAKKWSDLEGKILREFKARVRNHLGESSLPAEADDEFTWLALMQHYGVPTRLLDFTYSPFVALYFAIRSGHERTKGSHVRVEAIDAEAVNWNFKVVARNPVKEERRDPDGRVRFRPAVTHPDSLPTPRDNDEWEDQELRSLIARSLSATGKDREGLKKRGCVCVAPPSVFNPRLVNQQGVFLVNFAQPFLPRSGETRMKG